MVEMKARYFTLWLYKKQGRKCPLDTPERKIERRERERDGEIEIKREIEREREIKFKWIHTSL